MNTQTNDIAATIKNRVQGRLKKFDRPDSHFFAHLMIGVSKARFAELGFKEDYCQPVAFRADIRHFHTPLYKRIALGLGNAPAPSYPHHLPRGDFLYHDHSNQLVEHVWDLIGDSESAEAYLERHFVQMNIRQIIHLPNEPSYMQSTVAMRWANQLGFPIKMPTVRKYIENHGFSFNKIMHIHTESFFNYLHKWGKRPGESPYNIENLKV